MSYVFPGEFLSPFMEKCKMCWVQGGPWAAKVLAAYPLIAKLSPGLRDMVAGQSPTGDSLV